MGYLFLSFSEHLTTTSRNKSDLYNASLVDQFEVLQRRIPPERRTSSLEVFIERCFPSGIRKKYYFSCPNFLREKKQVNDGKAAFLNNVVIRPEFTLSMKQCLPDNQNIILIGDVYESDRLRMFQVKGLELIDEGVSSQNDMLAEAEACSAFERNAWSIRGADYSETLFTPNFIADLIEGCYTVSNPGEVRKVYEEWNRYFQFRNYYLEEQSKRNFLLDSCEFVNSYAINRKDYKKNSLVYDEYILDDSDDFKKGDMVVLSQKVAEAEDFPLIRLTIDRNKKEFDAAKVLKGNKLVSEEERKIRSLASDNVFITSINPESNEAKANGKTNFGTLFKSGYALGDRFRVITKDIEPSEHLKQLEFEYGQNLDLRLQNIDDIFDKKISDELTVLCNQKDEEIASRASDLIEERRRKLNDSLKQDVTMNSDPDILRQVQTRKSEIKSSTIKKLKKSKDESENEFHARRQKLIDDEISKIDVESYYLKRNVEDVKRFGTSLISKGKRELEEYKKQKRRELANKYSDDIRSEKIKIKEELDAKLKEDKAKAIEEETIHRFCLYFRLGDPNNEIKEKQKETIRNCKYIVYDNRAELAKIKRQQSALENFYSGFVKNPYLSTYLFNPESLQPITANYGDWKWYLSSLNEKQKEAVRKAVSSNGIFLLQGPPGTGKTQVIAEIVAHMVEKGKKVLVSSETHKAIDNVFERLPKIPDIVPVRLIPSNNRKGENEYDPKFLVDNLYRNISANMVNAVHRYENFNATKEEFKSKFEGLQLLKAKIDKWQNALSKAEEEIKQLEKSAKAIGKNIAVKSDERDDTRLKNETLRRTIRHLEKNNFNEDDDIDINAILEAYQKIQDLCSRHKFKEQKLGQLLNSLFSIEQDELDKELSLINPKSNKTRLEIKKKEILDKIHSCQDEVGDALPGKEEEIKEYKAQFATIKNELSASSEESLDLKIKRIFEYDYIVANLGSLKDEIEEMKANVNEIKSQIRSAIEKEIEENESRLNAIDSDICDLKKRLGEINDQVIDIQDREEIKEIQDDKAKLQFEIDRFFKDFQIAEPYDSIEDALKVIDSKWKELEKDQALKEKENKEKIPIYKEISDYLSSEEVIDEDRKTYTKDLFENANVFGITCTSNDRFSGRNNSSLSEYNIDDVDIKKVGIDVVIIDEVSKSSFIDLLIPILYGKTVILVGDHRQLPPMYEFAKLRDDDFKGLDENIINRDINDKFTKLYEECFFKTLFEKIPDSYKTMLVQQYRCHEQIMNVFNAFYQGELRLGFSGQNNQKKHNIRIVSHGRTIIKPDQHIYFVDYKGKETHERDSTSMYNTGEAKVIAELIKKMNSFFKENGIFEKLSIGVICTYGDQARKVKEVLKSEKVKTDAFRTNPKKMIISTVDDFQGDERDIIILSMVRNPENPARSNPGFILAYQRINVALSRARKLLIVVGNRRYLEDKGVIDLPDIHGNGQDRKNFRVYEEIIGTIERYGKVIEDSDILGEEEVKING